MTLESESGNGCHLRDLMQGVEHLDTRIALLKRIEEQNKTDRLSSPDLPELKLLITAHKENGSLSSDVLNDMKLIYSETYQPDGNKSRIFCKNENK